MSLRIWIRDREGRKHLHLVEGAGVYAAIALVVVLVVLGLLLDF